LIEVPLSEHPAVANVAAVGKPDKRVGELPMAFVQLQPNAAVSINDLLDYAKNHISDPTAVPHQIEIIPTMPLTGVGKIYKPALRILATKQVIEEELSVLKALGIKFDISVNIDNTQRLIASITVGDNIKEEVIKKMQSRLEDYSFKIEFIQNGVRIDLTDSSKQENVLAPNSILKSAGEKIISPTATTEYELNIDYRKH
jgi:fatty-acyl-CoA synthase